jgi:hypothetical protein
MEELKGEGFRMVKMNYEYFMYHPERRVAYRHIGGGPSEGRHVQKDGYLYAMVSEKGAWVFEPYPFEKLMAFIREEELPTEAQELPPEGRMVGALALSVADPHARPLGVGWMNPHKYSEGRYYVTEYWRKVSEGSDTKPPIPFSSISGVWKVELPEFYWANELYVLSTDQGWFAVHVKGYPEGYAVSVYQDVGGKLYEHRSVLKPVYDPELGAMLKKVGEERVPAAVSEPAATRAKRLLGEALRRRAEKK